SPSSRRATATERSAAAGETAAAAAAESTTTESAPAKSAGEEDGPASTESCGRAHPGEHHHHQADDAGDDGEHERSRHDAARKVALAEQGRNILGNDPPRGHVRERPLEAITHLDAHLLVVLGDHEQRAIVLTTPPDLPALRGAQ